MKTLKVKSILFSLMAFVAVSVFMTSCEQDAIVDDSITESNEISLANLDLRSCAPSPNIVEYNLYLITFYVNLFDDIRDQSRKDDVIEAFDEYQEYLIETLLPCTGPFINSLVFSEWGSSCSDGPNYPACPEYAISALKRLQCDINDFLNNPSSYTARRNLQIRFSDYIRTLNTCFDAGISIQNSNYDLDILP